MTGRRRKVLAVIAVCAGVALGLARGVAPAAAHTAGCPGVAASASCGVIAQPGAARFHGLIAVPGADWVFARAATSGTSPGCGDCVWSIVVACPQATPASPDVECVAPATSPVCPATERLYRLYLTSGAGIDVAQGSICLGGDVQPVPVGDLAQQAAERYVRNVRPPDLLVTTKPRTATLAGLETYFEARAPGSLRPVDVSGDGIVEQVSLAPLDVLWQWGDGSGSGWAAPGSVTSHTYSSGGIVAATLTAHWGATYTITYQGVTLGPFDAVGRLTGTQPLTLAVRTSSPVLTRR
jgi:hypothetical protein